MNTFKYFLLSVACIVALFLPAKSEPLPSGGSEDTDEVENQNESLKTCRYPGTCSAPSSAGICETCRDGFVKDPEDATRCEYANQNAKLLVTFREQVKTLSLDGKHMNDLIEFDRTSNHSFFNGADYDLETNTLFWFDEAMHQVSAAPITHKPEDEIILLEATTNSYSVAVDWIYQHLYFINSDDLFVCNFNGKMKKNLSSIGQVDMIALNPLKGWVYWTSSRLDFNRIERAAMDGSQREDIRKFDKSTAAPVGLVIDFVDSRLYWTQGIDPSSIWSSDLDGSDSKLIFSGKPEGSYYGDTFWKIATFDKYIYFIELHGNTIYKVNKCGGSNELETVFIIDDEDVTQSDTIFEIKVFDATVQPKVKNLCTKRADKCSQFCFPVPNKGSVSTTCACQDGFSLSADQHNCEENPKDEEQ